MTICIFSDVSEKDMDLLFMEEFVCSQDFLNLFLQKINLVGAELVSLEQSKTDKKFGESDITVVVEKNGLRHGLLIEDKIDAIAMPQQANRYFKRGEKGKENGDYAAFSIFIVAPQGYLDVNEEAKRYPNHISYEKCLDYFQDKTDPRSSFKRQQLEQAIKKQKSGWQAVTDETITEFWNKYDAYQAEHFDKLDLIKSSKGKPSNSFWRTFRTGQPKIHIVHKGERGCVDMEFSGLGGKIAQLSDLCAGVFGNLYEKELQIENAKKSAVLHCPALMTKIDFSRPFEEQTEIVKEALEEVERLRKLLDDLPKEKLFTLFE